MPKGKGYKRGRKATDPNRVGNAFGGLTGRARDALRGRRDSINDAVGAAEVGKRRDRQTTDRSN